MQHATTCLGNAYDVFSYDLGMLLGEWISRKYELLPYHWKGVFEYQTMTGRLTRAIQQFLLPQSWKKVEWFTSRTIFRFLIVQIICVSMQLIELNAFFLKSLLYIPDGHVFNQLRLLLWFFLSLPALRQIYIFVSDQEAVSLGRNTYLAVVVQVTELMLIFKFSWSV